VALAVVLESVRAAGLALTLGSVLIAWGLFAVVTRPRLMIAAIVATPIALGAVLSYPAAQLRVYAGLQAAARYHWGHIVTPGYVYTLLDQRLYDGKAGVDDLQFGEAARFVARAFERYVTVPLPWEVQSRAALVYLPEQVIWYAIVVCVPFGLVGALRRDALVASVLCGYALLAVAMIAMTSGNIGTLVRHRGLALPYLASLSAVGACDLIRRARGRLHRKAGADWPHGPFEVHPTWR